MAGHQYGRGAGITGTVDLAAFAPKFGARIYGYNKGLKVQTKARVGRGTNRWVKLRTLFSSGTIALVAELQLDAWPQPSDWRGQTGTLSVQVHTGRTISLAILVEEAGYKKDEKTEDIVKVALLCRITAAPTFTGWPGTQPTATDPEKTNVELYEGTAKSKDPQGLASSAQRTTDVWGTIPDNDTAETQLLADLIAAANPPFAGLKLRLATFNRDSLDGGSVVEQWGLTDTAEDVTNPRTRTTVDDQHVASNATAAAINTPPAAPAGDAFVLRTSSSQELNDGATLNEAEYGLRDTVDDVEMEGTRLTTDPTNLAHDGQDTIVHPTASPPASPTLTLPTDAQVIATVVQEINRLVSKKTFLIGMRTPKQEIEWIQSKTTSEAGMLRNGAIVVQVTASATADPSGQNPDVTNLSHSASVTHRLTTGQWVHAHAFLPLTATEDEQESHSAVVDDPGASLVGDDRRCVVDANAAAPLPPVVSGRSCVKVVTVRIAKVRYRHDYFYDFRDNGARLEAERYRATTDPSSIDDETVSADVFAVASPPADPAAPAGLVLREKFDVETPNPLYRLRVYRFARTTREQDLEFAHTKTQTDPSGLEDQTLTSDVFDNASPPADPAAPAGLKLVNKYDVPVTPARSKRVWEFSRQTNKDKLEQAHTHAHYDVVDAGRVATATLVDSVETAAFLALQYFNTFKSSVTFQSVEIQKRNDGKALVVINTRDDQMIVRYQMFGGGKQWVPAVREGGVTYVFMNQRYKRGTSLWSVEIAAQPVLGAQMRFTLYRRKSGAVAELYLPLIGTTNDNPFMGLPAGTVSYVGQGGGWNLSVDTPHVFDHAYHFFFDSLGLFEPQTVCGWFNTARDLSGLPERDWIDAAELGWSAVGLPGADYAVFLQ